MNYMYNIKYMSFEIDSIWIEYEFIVPNGIDSILEIATKELRRVNATSDEFTITIDREYYSEQVEFKLMRTTNIQWWIEFFQKAMQDMYKVIKPIHSTTRKHFVGTHIHMFLNKDWVPYTKFAQWKKVHLVNYAYGEMSKFLISSVEKWRLLRKTIKDEMYRLTTNHNILRFFDESIGNKIKHSLEEYGMSYQQFHSGTDRPKYTPVLWSLANETTWKPHSLEVRCIPNTFLMTEEPKKIADYIYWVANVLNNKAPTDLPEAIQWIVNQHKVMLDYINWNLHHH